MPGRPGSSAAGASPVFCGMRPPRRFIGLDAPEIEPRDAVAGLRRGHGPFLPSAAYQRAVARNPMP